MTRLQWLLPMLVTLLIAVTVNGALLAYSYGQLDQRVATLEKLRDEQRAEWKAARERIETWIKEMRGAK